VNLAHGKSAILGNKRGNCVGPDKALFSSEFSFNRPMLKVHENTPVSFNDRAVDFHELDSTAVLGTSYNGSTTYINWGLD
jgi:hypothetical protein